MTAVSTAVTAASPAGTAVADPSTAAVPDTPAEALEEGQPAPAGVLNGRARIDDLDRRILELITERMAVSAEVGAARIAAGGRRLDIKREGEIISRYSTVLGRPGVTIAMQLLELCRGKI
jgi:chorismate mutase